MKHIIVAIFLLSTCYQSADANIMNDTIGKFISKLSKLSKGKVSDVVKKLPKSKAPLRSFNSNMNVPRLITKVNKDPQKLLLISKADEIVSKGAFEKRFFNNQPFDNQLAIIVQSSKYGDDYFTIAKKVSSVTPDVLIHNPQIAKYISQGKLTEKTLQTSFITTLEHGGKYAWEKLNNISKWILKNPTKSGAGVLYAWYVIDPESFNLHIKSAFKDAGTAALEGGGSALSGIGEAVNEKWEEAKENIEKDIENYVDNKVDGFKASESYIVNVLVGILGFIILFIVWRKRNVIKDFLMRADKVKNTKEEIDNEY